MCRENPTWDALRIHRELLKLGIDIGETCLSKYMVRGRKPPSQTWRAFLQNHAQQLIAADALEELVWKEVSTRLQDPGLGSQAKLSLMPAGTDARSDAIDLRAKFGEQLCAALVTLVADVAGYLAFFLHLVEGRFYSSASILKRLQFCAVDAVVFIFKTS